MLDVLHTLATLVHENGLAAVLLIVLLALLLCGEISFRYPRR